MGSFLVREGSTECVILEEKEEAGGGGCKSTRNSWRTHVVRASIVGTSGGLFSGMAWDGPNRAHVDRTERGAEHPETMT